MKASPPRSDAWWFAAAALLLAWMLGQETLYNRDAHILLLRMQEGKWMHNHHFTFFPVVQTLHLVGAQIGLSLYESARLASALGMAVGVLFTHLACRQLRMPRGTAALTTALVACCPAVLFFATVVEVHGPYLAGVGLAWWATARLIARPGLGSAAILGACMGLAYCAHATANLMPAVLLPLAYARLRETCPELGERRTVGLCALPLVVHGALVVSVPAILGAFGWIVRTEDALDIITQPLELLLARPDWPWQLPRLTAVEIGREWLRPMAPLSVAFLAGLWHRRLRLQTGLLALALVPYVALTVVVLTPYPVNSEHGAYFLPFAWPAALLVVAALPRPWTLGLAALSLVVAVAEVKIHDEPERSRAWAEGLAEHAGKRTPFVLLGDYPDLEAVHLRVPDLDHTFLAELVSKTASVGVVEREFLDYLDSVIAAKRAEGRVVYLTAGMVSWLDDATTVRLVPLAAAVMKHLRERYELTTVESKGFSALLLTPK